MINQKDLPPSHLRTNNKQARVINVKPSSNNMKIRLDRLFRSPEPRILIKRRLGGIGDVIMSTPLIKALKNLIPHCHITYATDLAYADGSLADVILHNPYVDELVQSGTVSDESYDYSVDITATGLSREKSGHVPPNRIDMFAEEAGISVDSDPVPDYVLSAEEILSGRELIKTITNNSNKKLIVLQPRSNDYRRTWPAAHVNELCSLLSKEYFVLVLEWGNKDINWFSNESCVVLRDLDLNVAAEIIYHSDLVVCPDSSILHLAGALRKSIVSIFGPIPAQSRINHYNNCVAIQLDVPCKNCWYTPRCKDSDRLRCLTDITPEMVLSAVKNKLNGTAEIKSNIIYGKDLTQANQDHIILVKRNAPGLGDLLMAANGIEALKRKYQDKQIHVAIQPGCFPALENNPHIDKLLDITKPINSKRYFAVMDITSPCAAYESSRVATKRPVDKNRTEIYATALGVRNLMTDLLPRYYVSKEERLEAEELLFSSGSKEKKTIALTTTSAEMYRDWPKEHTSELCRLLKDYNVVNLNPNTTYEYALNIMPSVFRKVAALIAVSDLLISVDTGPLHVGAALGIPTIALFGPIDYKARCKGYSNITVVTADLGCIPCWRNSKIKCKQTDVIQGYSKCLQTVSAPKVFQIVRNHFEGK